MTEIERLIEVAKEQGRNEVRMQFARALASLNRVDTPVDTTDGLPDRVRGAGKVNSSRLVQSEALKKYWREYRAGQRAHNGRYVDGRKALSYSGGEV